MTRLESTLAAACCLAIIVAGVALLGGLAWSLIIGGVLGLMVTFLLFDPAAKRGKRQRKTADQLAAVRNAKIAEVNWNG